MREGFMELAMLVRAVFMRVLLRTERDGTFPTLRLTKNGGTLLLTLAFFTCAIVAAPPASNEASEATASEPGPSVDSRERYVSSLESDAKRLGVPLQYSLEGVESDELTIHYPHDAEGLGRDYLRPDGPIDQSTLAQLGISTVRVVMSNGTTLERSPDGKITRAAKRTAPPTAEERALGIRAMARGVPLFVSKDAMSQGQALIAAGNRNPSVLGPMLSCVTATGDKAMKVDAGMFSSGVLIVEGPNSGCRGWTDNEHLR